MQDARERAREQYRRARAEFEKLETQDKTAFVLEATFATLGQAFEDAGRIVADVFERAASYDFAAGAEAPDAEPAATPPSAKKGAAPKPPRTDPNGGEGAL